MVVLFLRFVEDVVYDEVLSLVVGRVDSGEGAGVASSFARCWCPGNDLFF